MRINVFAALLLAAAGPAYAAGPEQGKFSISVFGGADRPISGDVHTGAVAPVPDLGPLNPALAGVSAELRIRSRSHEQIYGTAKSFGLELGYGLSDRSEIFLQAKETSADDGRVRVGAAYVPALDTELDVFGRFSGYDAYTWEVGYRHFFRDGGRVRPFVSARLGATETDDIRATFEIPDAAITIPNAPFYEKDWALSGGLEAGAQISFTERFSMRLTAGVNYIDDLSGDDSAIGGLGLARINDTGKRVSVPISVTGRFDF